MYNGIGLTTPRGSGTSGYVQKSLAFVKPRQIVHNYKEVLDKFKENPAPTKKKANVDIIEHETKHKIEVQVFEYMEQLKNNNVEDEEINNLVNKKRDELYDNLKFLTQAESGEGLINFHAQSKLKDAQMEKIKNALGVRKDYEHGTAFDLDFQEEKKQKKLLERKEEKRIIKKDIKKRKKEDEVKEKEKVKEIEKAKEIEKTNDIDKVIEIEKLKAKEFEKEREREKDKERDRERDNHRERERNRKIEKEKSKHNEKPILSKKDIEDVKMYINQEKELIGGEKDTQNRDKIEDKINII